MGKRTQGNKRSVPCQVDKEREQGGCQPAPHCGGQGPAEWPDMGTGQRSPRSVSRGTRAWVLVSLQFALKCSGLTGFISDGSWEESPAGSLLSSGEDINPGPWVFGFDGKLILGVTGKQVTSSVRKTLCWKYFSTNVEIQKALGLQRGRKRFRDVECRSGRRARDGVLPRPRACPRRVCSHMLGGRRTLV